MMRIIHCVQGVGIVDEIREGLQEKYLDELVIEECFGGKKSPQEFLDGIWPVHQVGHIGTTIQRRVLLDEIPDGFLYTFTPNDGFKYQKRGREVFSAEMTHKKIGESFTEAVLNMGTSQNGQGPLRNVLFFNEVSREKLTSELWRIEAGFLHTTPLPVSKYGTIYLYTYQIRLPPQPYR